MTAQSPTNPTQVVILGDYLPFPHGMAKTSRARLVARALCESGVEVRVLTLQADGLPSPAGNTVARGEYEGIPFEYACGTTRRSDSFVTRRLISVWGWTRGAMRLVQLRRHGRLDLVHLWFWTPRPAARVAFFVMLLRLLRVPIVCEIDESTWSMKARTSLLERLWSPLAGMDGAVTISGELRTWATRERRDRVSWPVIEAPILVDVTEQRPGDYPIRDPLVVFAGSPDYRATMQFIFAAMQEVWRLHPTCRIAMAGASPDDPRAKWLWEEARRARFDTRIDLLGFLSRPELLELYGRAHALLIPLFDDLQSRTRFPTKIGEYLAAARPTVTNAVGEIPRYLTDGIDAVVCPPGDPIVFGRAISDLLSDPARAALIGRRGRVVAETRFHYQLHGERLAQAFAEVAGYRPPQ